MVLNLDTFRQRDGLFQTEKKPSALILELLEKQLLFRAPSPEQTLVDVPFDSVYEDSSLDKIGIWITLSEGKRYTRDVGGNRHVFCKIFRSHSV